MMKRMYSITLTLFAAVFLVGCGTLEIAGEVMSPAEATASAVMPAATTAPPTVTQRPTATRMWTN